MPKRIIDITPPASADKPTAIKVKAVKKAEVRPKVDFKVEKPAPKFTFKKSFLIAPVLIILGAVAYFTLSKAEISIWPKTETINSEAKLIVDRASVSADFADKIIPGAIFETEKTISDEFLSSGKKISETKAEGRILICNNYQSDQVLLANTRFQAALEKFQPALTGQEKPWFRTVERMAIASKGCMEVRVVADSAGEKYNIKPSMFSIPGLAGTAQYTQIYGESKQEFKGGQKTEVPQVSKEDLVRAQNQLKEQGISQNRTDLLAKIPPEMKFVEDSFKTDILATSSLVKAGAEVDKFSYQIKIRSEVLAFKKEDLENFAKETILTQVSEGKKIDEVSFKYDYSVFSFDSKTKNLTFSVTSKALVYSDVNKISLKEGLSGLSLTEAKLFLETQSQIDKSQIKLWPFWQRKIPKNAEKIKLELIL
jgi:hypothetical protein